MCVTVLLPSRLDTLPGFSGMLQSKLQSSTSSSSSSSSSRTAATGGAESEGGSRSNTAVSAGGRVAVMSQ